MAKFIAGEKIRTTTIWNGSAIWMVGKERTGTVIRYTKGGLVIVQFEGCSTVQPMPESSLESTHHD